MNNPINTWRKTKELHTNLGNKGKIVVWTKLYVAPEGFEKQVPYVVAIVEFKNKERKTLQVVDYDEENLKDGLQVITVVRKIGEVSSENVIAYGLKVKPL